MKAVIHSVDGVGICDDIDKEEKKWGALVRSSI